MTARALGKVPDDLRTLCNFSVTLHYDGAAATVVFDESGAPDFPRERLSVFAHGQVAILDDFAKLTEYGPGKPRSQRHRPAQVDGPRRGARAVRPRRQGRAQPPAVLGGRRRWRRTCMFAAQESIRLGAEIDLDQFRQSLLARPRRSAEPEEAPAGVGG